MRHVPLSDLQANAAELNAAIDAGEEVVITMGTRDYRLVAAAGALALDRRRAMEEAAAFRQELRDRGVRVTRDEVRAWIDLGRH